LRDLIVAARGRFNDAEMAAAQRCSAVIKDRVEKLPLTKENWETNAEIYHQLLALAHKQGLHNLKLWAFAWEMSIREVIYRLDPKVDWDRLCP
jgi:hypothetical protein